MRENPYQPFRRVRGAVDSAKRVTDERFGAWELGYNARCPEGWVVVRLDEHEARMRECEALRLEREDARAERDAAITAGQKLADALESLVTEDEGRAHFTSGVDVLSQDPARRCLDALTAWRAVSGSGERPEGETT